LILKKKALIFAWFDTQLWVFYVFGSREINNNNKKKMIEEEKEKCKKVLSFCVCTSKKQKKNIQQK
jgi:hypothetical protein